MNTRWRRWRRRIVLVTSLGVGLWLFASWLVVDQLTRRGRQIGHEPVPNVSWASFREVRLSTTDGEELGAWFVAGRPDRVPVLVLHGNGATRTDCLDIAEFLAAEGYPVLLVTLRAHGDSTGERNDFGYSARHDVIAAIRWLEENCPGRPVIWGRSLGSAAAIFAAGELDQRVSGYILECPYQDLRTAVWNRVRSRVFPPLSWVAYAGLSVTAPLVLDDVDRISPLNAAGTIPKNVPVLLLAGESDRSATPEEASDIGERIGPRAEIIVFENAGHLGLFRADPIRYREAGARFLAGCAQPVR